MPIYVSHVTLTREGLRELKETPGVSGKLPRTVRMTQNSGQRAYMTSLTDRLIRA